MALPPDMDLSKIPIMANPSGEGPNFANGPSMYPAMLESGIALIVVGGFFLILRLATNLKVARKIGLDDLLCVFAFAGGAGYWALNLSISKQGATKHAWDVPLSFMSSSMAKMQLAILILIAPTMWAAKSAILALYIRVFGSITWLRRTAYAWIVFMALFYSMNVVVGGVYCIPRKGEVWGGASFARCATNNWPHVVVGVFSCLADLLILILPFPIVARLHVDRRRKIALGVVFGTGIILVGLSGVSLYFRVLVYRGIDPTWNAALLAILTVAEIFGTVVVSCAPAISSFWHKILTQSNLWSEIKSSSIFSSLKSRFSEQSSVNSKPSFVRPSKYDHEAAGRTDTSSTLKGTRSNVSEVDSFKVSGSSRNEFITSPL
ncbi:hypothetical protein CC86DRAFT_335890 [Ophiobolus disseminans]|uniref:Rhodopsin domain-containing protein n=1 Tax=Ophiobolus disseminans TaxID=1469910 RepID=A0A6A6ZEK8_9PLEO|nr:hypothetical protein CC86DRAFT_335890 [Ophiobolus disseminans]